MTESSRFEGAHSTSIAVRFRPAESIVKRYAAACACGTAKVAQTAATTSFATLLFDIILDRLPSDVSRSIVKGHHEATFLELRGVGPFAVRSRDNSARFSR